jgi:hypothetical protein
MFIEAEVEGRDDDSCWSRHGRRGGGKKLCVLHACTVVRKKTRALGFEKVQGAFNRASTEVFLRLRRNRQGKEEGAYCLFANRRLQVLRKSWIRGYVDTWIRG